MIPATSLDALEERTQVLPVYDEDLGDAGRAILNSVDAVFGDLIRYERLTPNDQRFPATHAIERVARDAAQVMLKAARPGKPEGAIEPNQSVIEDRVALCITRRIPIPAQMLWSPKKHWVVGAESDVDLAELAALNTLHALHAGVREVYHPGISITLFLEDLEFEFMEGTACEVVDSRKRYTDGLRRLITVLGLDDVLSMVRISDKAADEELREWRAQMEENYEALEAYWYESEQRGIGGHMAYPSFRRLRDLGWSGPIPQEMRDHYLRRLGSSPEWPMAGKVSMILRNLSGILLHHQKHILRTDGAVDPVKLSFVPPAPGAPLGLLKGRIDLRFVSRNICSRVGSAGPWSTKGYFRERDGRILPTFRSWHSPTEPGCRLVDGRLRLIRQDQCADVRADFLVEGSQP